MPRAMTDTGPPAPPPNLAVIKAITVGLGVLLVGGVVLLGALLMRGGGAARTGPAVFEAAPGERVAASSASAAGILIALEGPEGTRLVLIAPDGTVAQEIGVRTAPQIAPQIAP